MPTRTSVTTARSGTPSTPGAFEPRPACDTGGRCRPRDAAVANAGRGTEASETTVSSCWRLVARDAVGVARHGCRVAHDAALLVEDPQRALHGGRLQAA